VLRIYKSDWYRNVALVSRTSSYLGLVEFYLLFRNEMFMFWHLLLYGADLRKTADCTKCDLCPLI
jgi:hypothetical protein